MVRATTEATEVEKGGHMLLENRNFTGKLKPRQVRDQTSQWDVFRNQALQGSCSPKVRTKLASRTSKAPPLCILSHKIVRLEASWRTRPWPCLERWQARDVEEQKTSTTVGTREWESTGPSQDRKLIWKQEIKSSFLIMPHPPKRISPVVGKCFGEHQSHLCLSCVGSSLLSHLEALTRVLQFKAGVPIYSKFI